MTRTISAMIVALVLTAAASTATASSWGTSGNICVGTSGTVLHLHPWGATNGASSGSPATVECPLSTVVPQTNVTVRMSYYDRSTTADILCTISAFDFNGAYLGDVTLNSSGGGPNTGLVTISKSMFPLTFTLTASCSIPNTQNSGGIDWMSHIVAFYTL
jgi:hypothetical protein